MKGSETTSTGVEHRAGRGAKTNRPDSMGCGEGGREGIVRVSGGRVGLSRDTRHSLPRGR